MLCDHGSNMVTGDHWHFHLHSTVMHLTATCVIEDFPFLLLFATEYHERSGHGISKQIGNRIIPAIHMLWLTGGLFFLLRATLYREFSLPVLMTPASGWGDDSVSKSFWASMRLGIRSHVEQLGVAVGGMSPSVLGHVSISQAGGQKRGPRRQRPWSPEV